MALGPGAEDEEPLGFSVEEMPVMGEPFEVERAAAILQHSAATASPPRRGRVTKAGSFASSPGFWPSLAFSIAWVGTGSVASAALLG